MNHYRVNQIAMAVLVPLLLFFGTRTIINIAFEKQPPGKPGYEVEGVKQAEKPQEKQGGQGQESAAELAALLAKAEPAKGAEVAKKCQLCHNFDKGGPNMIGPNLYGVLDRDVASHEGFDYSPALKAKGGKWDYASISAMDANPGAYVPGTKMSLFQGLPDPKQRADLLAFMRTKDDNPPPLPEVKGGGRAPAPATPEEQAANPEAQPHRAQESKAELDKLLAKADSTRGAEVAKKCQMCHNFDKGGPNLIGPNLYGVLGRKIASQEGFDYSPALKAKEGNWDYETINAMITNPNAFAPGTKMALFPGLPDAKQRADVIAYLRTKNDNPPPLPGESGGGAPQGQATGGEQPAPAAPVGQHSPANP